MKAPTSWLRKFIEINEPVEDIAETLTLAGLEVDKIDRYTFSFSGIIVGRIEEVTPHPEASKLIIVMISNGKSTRQIVCGDSTLKKGMLVPFAPVGALVNTQEGELVEIKKVKLRGIESLGMLLSEKELGISTDTSKVMRLPGHAPVGEDITDFLTDPTFDIALTPNLGYCRSIIGIARELGAQYNKQISLPQIVVEEDPDNTAQTKIQVTNNTHADCLQYCTRVVQGVEIGPSPGWLQDLLIKSGHKCINNVVDVTNYVMHELGQPIHAFDYDKLQDKHLTVRNANDSEKLITLDGIERNIPERTVLICDGETPVAIGGVMGGLNSAIHDKTHTVVLEAAEFNPSSIRRTSKALGLRSESSGRFENKINSGGLKFALDRAAVLLQEVAGGRILKGIVEQSPKPPMPKFITCRLSKINALLGMKFSLNEVRSYLDRLEISSSDDGEDLFQLKIPSWRRDIESEIDIVEEVARIFGYGNIERKRPRHVNTIIEHHPIFRLEKTLRNRLISIGLQEFLTCNLISPELCDLEIEHGIFSNEYISVLHAKSVEQSILRPSLLPGLLQSIKTNQNQGNVNIQAFELGRVHFKEGDKYDEKTSLGIILTGDRKPIQWDDRPSEVDFYDLKGILQNLFCSLLLPEVTYDVSSFKTFHPGRQTALKFTDSSFGVMGEVHPATCKKLDIKRRVLFAEIDLHTLQQHRPNQAHFYPLPIFPESQRDLTINMKESVRMETVFEALRKSRSPILKKVHLIDIYRGEKIGKEMKNVTLRFVYRDDAKTLSIKNVEDEHDKIVRTLEKTL